MRLLSAISSRRVRIRRTRTKYYITRRLELRQGWAAHREALDELFTDEFQRLVVEFDSMEDPFDALVDRLEDIGEASGGDVEDDDRDQRVTYSRDGASFTFDLKKRRRKLPSDARAPSTLSMRRSGSNWASVDPARCWLRLQHGGPAATTTHRVGADQESEQTNGF